MIHAKIWSLPQEIFYEILESVLCIEKEEKEGKKKRDEEEEALIMEREIKRGKEREKS